MIKQFYEKLLPRQGVYCIGELDRSQPKGKQMRHHYAETLDELFNKVESVKSRKHDCYVSPSTYQKYKRAASECVAHKSFFIDFDVNEEKAEEGKAYATKEEAVAALDKFIADSGLPPPVRVNSGIGLHAYWIFDQEVAADEFLPYAKKFKSYCKDLITIFDEEATPADLARFMRVVGSTNYRPDPPAVCEIISDEIPLYDFEEFKDFLGEPEVESANDILARVSKGLSEEERKMLGLDNFKYSFEKIVIRSIEGDGCPQIADVVFNPNTVSRNTWAGVLTVAVRCDDGDTAIHKISEDYDNYDPEETYKVAHSFDGCRRCSWFEENSDKPELCGGCSHRGRISSPIQLGKEIRIARTPSAPDSIWQEPDTQKVQDFPDMLRPFYRGVNGGVLYQPPPVVDKKGVKHEQDPVVLLTHDLYPIRRMFSTTDGECLTLRLELPKDGAREFLFPMKLAYSKEEFKKALTSQGAFFNQNNAEVLMNYIIKWGQYLESVDRADIMRMQMGWTEDNNSFIIGKRELTRDGKEHVAAASPFVKGLSKLLVAQGSYDKWKKAAAELNRPGFEIHAFTMLTGFGSPLMRYTSTSGVVLSLHGKSGCAKTGAMYGALSAFGNPKELSIFDATHNGMIGRLLGLHNIVFGVDETSNMTPLVASQLTHAISHGKAKIRMQASVNAEREYEMSASGVGIFTTNNGMYAKFEILKANPDGEAARMVEIMVQKPPALAAVGGAKLGADIFDTFRTNFGFAGPEFIKEVFRLGDAYVMEQINKWGDRFDISFGDDSTYRFYKNLVTSTMTAGTITNQAGITNLDLDRIYHAVLLEMIQIRDKVIKVNRTDYDSILGDFINSSLGKVLVIKNDKVVMEPKGAIVARIETDKDLLQVSKAEIRKFLTERQVSTREFEHDMRSRGILFDEKKGRLTSGWKSGVSASPAYLYWLKSKIPDEWFADDTKSDS